MVIRLLLLGASFPFVAAAGLVVGAWFGLSLMGLVYWRTAVDMWNVPKSGTDVPK